MDEQERKRMKYSDKREVDAETELNEEMDQLSEKPPRATEKRSKGKEGAKDTVFESSTEAEEGLVDKSRTTEKPKDEGGEDRPSSRH